MRSLGRMFVGGIAALVALKVLFGLVVPTIAFVVGVAWTVVKLALVVGIGWLVYSFVRDRKRESAV